MPDGCTYVEEASKWMLMGMGTIAAQIPAEQYEAWADDMANRVAYLAEKLHEQIHPPETSNAATRDPSLPEP